VKGVKNIKDTNIIRNKPYMLYITNVVLSYLGNRLTFLVIIQLMMFTEYKIFGVATVTLIRLLPVAMFSTLAGKVSKKYKDSNVLIFGDLIEGITILLIVFFRNPKFILIIFAINSIIDVFADVSGFSFYDKLIDREDVNSANSVLSFVKSIINILGPILAAITLGVFGITVALIIDSITFFIGALTTIIIKYHYGIDEKFEIKEEVQKEEVQDENRLNQKFSNAFYLIKQNYKLKYMFLMLLITVFITEAQAPFMYIFGEEYLGVEVSVSGMFISAIGVGSALASLMLLKFPEILLDLKTIFYSVFIDGLALIILSNSKNIVVAFLAFTIFGITGAVFFVAMRNLIQLEVPKDRISEIYGYRFASTSIVKIMSIVLSALLVKKFINTTQLFKISGYLEMIAATIMFLFYSKVSKKMIGE